MEGTFHITNGAPGANGTGPGAKWRVVVLALTVALGAALVIWVSHTAWDRADRLQRQFASLNADSFAMGTGLRGEVQHLNDVLLRYRLRGDTNDYNSFYADAAELRQWIDAARSKANAPLEREFLAESAPLCEAYLAECGKVIEANRHRWLFSTGLNFQDSYEKVQSQSAALLALCNTFIDRQRAAFADFLQESDQTLANFKQLLELAVALLLLLAAALVFLTYRGMIAPLRQQLDHTQAIVVRQEKLASLGVLAAGVAHEIRNPLTAIKVRLYSLKKSLPALAHDEDAAVIGDEINRLERIVQDFLQFARPSEPELVAIPAERIAREAVDLLQPQLNKAAIRLRLEESEPVWVRVDSHQIKQVLINLIQNSADSIGRDGAITLRVSSESRRAVVEVADNGKGIPPDVQKRLFDPFFTTKEGGTGLGLPIAARIVEKHGGELRYSTEARRGTTFRVFLPRVDQHET